MGGLGGRRGIDENQVVTNIKSNIDENQDVRGLLKLDLASILFSFQRIRLTAPEKSG
jgi:hypothetical protein